MNNPPLATAIAVAVADRDSAKLAAAVPGVLRPAGWYAAALLLAPRTGSPRERALTPGPLAVICRAACESGINLWKS